MKQYIQYIKVFMFFMLAVAAIMILPFFGMEFIGVGEIFTSGVQREIFFTLRLPRALTAFVAGGGLAVSGLVFQSLFRNPMADPFTLGVASGASFGASLMILTGVSASFFGLNAVTLGAMCGAALSFLLVAAFSARVKLPSPNTILLAGIAVNFFFASLLLFSQYISDMRETFKIVRWLMGGVDVFGYAPLLSMLPFVILGLALAAFNVVALDHFLTGDDIAQTRGVRVVFSRNVLVFAATLIVGGIVSVCGPVGFVGLMIPHFCRKIVGFSHKFLFAACLFAGGTFLVVCDTFARMIIAPAEIPVGVITSLFGAPFLIWVLYRGGIK